MMDSGPPSAGRGQCCMLCYRPLYGTGISIYHTKCYQTDKSLYARLMEVTNVSFFLACSLQSEFSLKVMGADAYQ